MPKLVKPESEHVGYIDDGKPRCKCGWSSKQPANPYDAREMILTHYDAMKGKA